MELARGEKEWNGRRGERGGRAEWGVKWTRGERKSRGRGQRMGCAVGPAAVVVLVLVQEVARWETLSMV